MEVKNYRAFVRQKRAEVHTPEEICAAFDGSFCAYFSLTDSSARTQLFGRIWEINPDAIIAETDLFVAHREPEGMHGQYLVICKNGTRESNNLLGQHLEESGVITSPWFINSKKMSGLKTCYHLILGSDKPAVIMKANLLIDGDNLLLTVRHLSSADRARMKAE